MSPDVEVGDTVVFTRDGRSEATVTETFGRDSFMVEWMEDGEQRGQVFRETVFDRAPFVEHEPGERREQAELGEVVGA